jgi:hypothetical protein
MLTVLDNIFARIENTIISTATSVVLGFLLLLIPHIEGLMNLGTHFDISNTLFWESLWFFSVTSISVMSTLEFVIFLTSCFVIGINIVTFVVYLKRYRKNMKTASSYLSFWGTILALIGTGCLSCGVLILAPLVSIVGISFTTWISGNGVILSTFGLLLMVCSTYILLKQLANPQVCELPQ